MRNASTGLTGKIFYVSACLAALTSSWSASKLGPINLADAFLLAAVLFGSFSGRDFRGPLTIPFWLYIPTAAAAGLLALNVFIGGGSPWETDSSAVVAPLVMASRIAFSTLMVGLVILIAEGRGYSSLLRLLAFWALGVVVSSSVAIAQSNGVSTAGLGLEQTVSVMNGRYPGLASHPNSLAQACALAVPVLALFVYRLWGWKALAPAVGIATVMAAAFVSGSRAGIILVLAALMVATVLIGLFRFGAGGAIGIALFTLLGAALVLPSLLSRTRVPWFGTGAADSDLGRSAAIQVGENLFQESPIYGAGLGAWYGESGPLIVLVSGGLILAACYIIFLSVPLMRAVKQRREPYVALLLLAVLATLAFAGFNNGAFERFTFWPLLAAASIATLTRGTGVAHQLRRGPDPYARLRGSKS